jgi:molybdopterin converting factor small subunit
MLLMKVKLFGALRKYGDDTCLEIPFSGAFSVAELRTQLAQHLEKQFPNFNDQALLKECAIASDSRIFMEEEEISNIETIAVLPPVCGG